MENDLRAQIVEQLLLPLWEGIDLGYKERYRIDVWEHFENNIRVASYTSKLTKFFETITKLLPITIPSRHIESVEEILNRGQDREILRYLRYETTYLVLLLRTKKQKEKEEKIEKSKIVEQKEDSKCEPMF